MWVFIFLIRSKGTFWYQFYCVFLEFFVLHALLFLVLEDRNIIIARHVKFLKKKCGQRAEQLVFYLKFCARAICQKICIKQDWNLFKIMFRILKEAITFVVL